MGLLDNTDEMPIWQKVIAAIVGLGVGLAGVRLLQGGGEAAILLF